MTILFLSLISGGLSQDREREKDAPRGGKKPQGPNFGEFVKHHDRDEDGKVSLEEFAAGERAARLSEEARGKIFERLDKDGDGFITNKELKTRGPGFGNSFLKKADSDGDGRVSREEFLANPPFKKVAEERLNKMFDRMDQNDDGFLDEKDLGRMRPPGGGRPPRFNFKELDTDQNGSLNLKEFQEAPFMKKLPENQAKAAFARIDSDDDGQLSSKEMRSHLQKRMPKPPKGPKRPAPKK